MLIIASSDVSISSPPRGSVVEIWDFLVLDFLCLVDLVGDVLICFLVGSLSSSNRIGGSVGSWTGKYHGSSTSIDNESML